MMECFFDILPNETISYISKTLDILSLIRFMKTNSRFYNLLETEYRRRKKIYNLAGTWKFPQVDSFSSEVSITNNLDHLFIYQITRQDSEENIIPGMRPGNIHYVRVKMAQIDNKLLDYLLEILTKREYIKEKFKPVGSASQQIISPVL